MAEDLIENAAELVEEAAGNITNVTDRAEGILENLLFFIIAGIVVIIAVVLIIALVFIIMAAKNRNNNYSSNYDMNYNTDMNYAPEEAYAPAMPDTINTAASSKNIQYDPMIDIARVMTDDEEATVAKMRLLARDYPAFVAENQDWCNAVAKRVDSLDKDVLTTHFFANWLSGYTVGYYGTEQNPVGRFGCYVAGDESPRAILGIFGEVDRTLNYGLNLSDVSVGTNISSFISSLSEVLYHQRYTLLSLEPPERKGFFLFIIPMKDYNRVMENASKVDFKIYRQLMV
jgi:hypothetical protein